MKLGELLQELADAPENFEIGYSDEDTLEIISPNLGLNLYLTRGLSPRLKNEQVYIEFAVNNRYDITHKGNAIKVLSTVMAILRKYLRRFVKITDQYISFGAEKSEPSRVKLYDRIVPKINNLLKTIDYNWNYAPDNLDNSLKTYTWTKINDMKINEISTQMLGRYKSAAGKDARAADAKGDTAKANKRFSGIIKATKKQFDNETKKK